jgi:hypothetical protein
MHSSDWSIAGQWTFHLSIGSNGHAKVQWKIGGPFDPFDKWNVQWPFDFSIGHLAYVLDMYATWRAKRSHHRHCLLFFFSYQIILPPSIFTSTFVKKFLSWKEIEIIKNTFLISNKKPMNFLGREYLLTGWKLDLVGFHFSDFIMFLLE